MLEGIEEHHVADVLLKELHTVAKDNEKWGAKFSVLKESVEHHIKEEERMMFPAARAALAREELLALGARMRALKIRAGKMTNSRPQDLKPLSPQDRYGLRRLMARAVAVAALALTLPGCASGRFGRDPDTEPPKGPHTLKKLSVDERQAARERANVWRPSTGPRYGTKRSAAPSVPHTSGTARRESTVPVRRPRRRCR